jgi:hypothetical protein
MDIDCWLHCKSAGRLCVGLRGGAGCRGGAGYVHSAATVTVLAKHTSTATAVTCSGKVHSATPVTVTWDGAVGQWLGCTAAHIFVVCAVVCWRGANLACVSVRGRTLLWPVCGLLSAHFKFVVPVGCFGVGSWGVGRLEVLPQYTQLPHDTP